MTKNADSLSVVAVPPRKPAVSRSMIDLRERQAELERVGLPDRPAVFAVVAVGGQLRAVMGDQRRRSRGSRRRSGFSPLFAKKSTFRNSPPSRDGEVLLGQPADREAEPLADAALEAGHVLGH